MNYPIPGNIKEICKKEKPKDEGEMELVTKEFKKFLDAYLSLDDGDDNGRNSLATVTDIVSKDGEFPVKWTNYPFERDMAGRMMRTRNFTMQEGINAAGKKEVYVIAADRDWWDRNKFKALLITLVVGTIIGSLGNPLSSLIDKLINTEPKKTEVFQLRVQKLSTPILLQNDSICTFQIEKIDSEKH